MHPDHLKRTSLASGLHLLHEHMSEIVALHELICDNHGKPLDYRILDTNPAFTHILGIRWEDANGKLASEVYQQSPPPYLNIYARVAQSGLPEQFETYYAPMQKHFLISVFSPAPGQFATVATDITLRKEKELEARRLNRLYTTLSTVNQTVVLIQNETELLDAVCQAIVHKAGFCLVWIGRLDPISQGGVPLAATGVQPVSKEDILVFADQRPEGMGPTTEALRQQQPVVFQFNLEDPFLAPWKHLIQRFHISSAAAFPLFDTNGLWGNMTVYSQEPDAFSQQELALLEEVAADTSFALKRIQAEKRQLQITRLLEERERQLQTLISNIPGGVYQREVHAPWRVLYFSDGSQSITGRHPSDFTQGKLTYADRVHPEDLAELNRIVEEAVAAHRPYEASYRILRPDGQIRHVYEKGQASYDNSGSPVFLEGIILDHTAQCEAERLLRASQRELEAVYDQAPVIMLLLDENLKVLRANRTARDFSPTTGKKWNTCLTDGGNGPGNILQCVNALAAPEGCGSSDACMQCLLNQTLKEFHQSEQCCARVECQLDIKQSGKPTTISLEGNVCRLQINGHKRFLLCLNDVTPRIQAETERDRLQQQLFQAQIIEAIGHLAGGIAHDFNNILAGMILHHQELLENDSLPPTVRESITELNQLAERAANLTRQLLLYSRQSPMEKKAIDLNVCVFDFQKLLHRTVGEHIQVRLAPAPQPVWLEADAGMLGQVLLNLSVNARDAMPKGGLLRITVGVHDIQEQDLNEHPQGKTGIWATIEVADTGCGMPPEVLAHAFEPFFTTKPTGKGTGLGLATVDGIVKQHGGWLEVTSKVGIGTTFTIYLPVVANSSPTSSSQPSPLQIHAGSGTILLVEDDPTVRHGVAKCLRRAGYQVLEAGQGTEALQLWELRHQDIDLVFSDMVLPGSMSGLELIHALRAQKPDLRVILSSGYSVEMADWEQQVGHMFTLLPKPYTISKLTSTIAEVLGKPATSP